MDVVIVAITKDPDNDRMEMLHGVISRDRDKIPHMMFHASSAAWQNLLHATLADRL